MIKKQIYTIKISDKPDNEKAWYDAYVHADGTIDQMDIKKPLFAHWENAKIFEDYEFALDVALKVVSFSDYYRSLEIVECKVKTSKTRVVVDKQNRHLF